MSIKDREEAWSQVSRILQVQQDNDTEDELTQLMEDAGHQANNAATKVQTVLAVRDPNVPTGLKGP